MANILIAYTTREGQTEKIARRIAATLREAAHTVELLDTDRPSPGLDVSRFDGVIVGAPLHGHGYPHSVARFVRAQGERLARVPSAFFSVGLAVASRTVDGRAQTRPIVDAFLSQTAWQPAQVELIAGALPYSKYNMIIRFVMKRIAAKAGGDTDTSRDYEYTDWNAVDRFARDFGARLLIAPQATAPAPMQADARSS